jgi:ABC-type multidrug transport system fused ATPase/permease subunit
MATTPTPPFVPSTTPPPAPAQPPLSEGARIVDTFIAPSKTFTDLGAHAKWWSWLVPWLILSATAILFAYAVGEKVTFARAADNVLQAQPKLYDRIQAMKPEDRDKTIQSAEKRTRTGAYGFPATDIILWLIVSAALYATFMFVANAKVSFKLVLAIVAYGGLPGAIRFLLATATLFAGISPDAFNINNPVATNLGALFNAADNPVLYAAGSFIDIFAIWSLVLTAIGFTCVSKAKIGTALTIVFAWYLVFMGLIVGLVALVS